MKNSKEIIIGTLLIVAGAILYLGINYLNGNNFFREEIKYFAVYDHIDGLQPGNQIQVNGYSVGKVKTINFLPHKKGDLVVEFTIDEPNMAIPKNSTARIVSFDLLGTKGINLEMDYSSKDFYMPGDTIEGSTEISLKDEVNQQVLPLKNKVEGLILQFDSALGVVQGIFDEDFRRSISGKFTNTMQSLENIALTTDVMMQTNSSKITNVMTNMESISGNLKNNNEELTNIINNTSAISDSLAKINLTATFNKVDQAMTDLSQVLDKINSGEGTVGKLLESDTLYTNLEEATLELDKLLEDMRVNPKRYVHFSIFGKKEKSEDKPQKKPR